MEFFVYYIEFSAYCQKARSILKVNTKKTAGKIYFRNKAFSKSQLCIALTAGHTFLPSKTVFLIVFTYSR